MVALNRVNCVTLGTSRAFGYGIVTALANMEDANGHGSCKSGVVYRHEDRHETRRNLNTKEFLRRAHPFWNRNKRNVQAERASWRGAFREAHSVPGQPPRC